MKRRDEILRPDFKDVSKSKQNPEIDSAFISNEDKKTILDLLSILAKKISILPSQSDSDQQE